METTYRLFHLQRYLCNSKAFLPIGWCFHPLNFFSVSLQFSHTLRSKIISSIEFSFIPLNSLLACVLSSFWRWLLALFIHYTVSEQHQLNAQLGTESRLDLLHAVQLQSISFAFPLLFFPHPMCSIKDKGRCFFPFRTGSGHVRLTFRSHSTAEQPQYHLLWDSRVLSLLSQIK